MRENKVKCLQSISCTIIKANSPSFQKSSWIAFFKIWYQTSLHDWNSNNFTKS